MRGDLRIYLLGSHCAGKTTIARYISAKYNVPLITEVARTVLSEMETSLESMRADIEKTAEYQRKVFARQVEVEGRQKGSFVSDRAFDNLAYAAEHTMILGELYHSREFSEYVKRMAGGIVFFVRPHPSLLATDGIRENPAWESVVRIDGMIKLLLELNGIPYLPISTPLMQERCRIVDFVLTNWRKR